MSTTHDLATPSLTQRHSQELLTKRGLDPEWIAANCRSITAAQASDLLGYDAKSDGIWLEGANFQGQFKPDKAWKAPNEKGKPPKYRSSLGDYDAMLPHHSAIANYWDDFDALKQACYNIDGHPCLILTEGFFKAIAGCSHGLPTIALIGVEMGLTPGNADPQGKRYLVPTLERYAKAGFGFIIGFDADCATNKNVLEAQDKLAHQLKKFKVPVYSVTGLWKVDETFDNKNKGMDDYIKNHGEDEFRREVLAKAMAWEAQFQEEPFIKDIPPRKAAKELLEGYRNNWKYDLERQTWRYWDKIWIAVQDEVFTQVVYRDLEKMKNVNYATFSYVENTVKFLKTELLEREWLTFDRTAWIAFNDCVLEVATGLTHQHAPGFGFVSCLEHDYPKLVSIDPVSTLLDALRVNAPTFYSWAMQAQKGDPMKVLKLLAICNGTLKFRFFDLQMFVLLLGVPGAGKSTFARLLEKMVGKGNHGSAKLHKLGDDNVLAAIIDKQLVICPDEKKAGSDYSGLLSLTGADSIPYRPIYRRQASSRFYGTVILIANQYPFYGDTSGIARRECLVNFDTPISNRDSSVEKRIQGEVGAIMALALSMPDIQVTELLTGTGDAIIPDLKRQQWLNKVENDSVALFLEECVLKTNASDYTLLGGKGGDMKTLYGAYLAFCDENNSKSPFTRQNFRGHFIELCKEIGWNEVEAQRKESGWRVYGVRLRSNGEEAAYVSDLMAGCKPCRLAVDLTVDPKPLPHKEAVDPVDLTALLSREEQKENDFSPPPTAGLPPETINENFTPDDAIHPDPVYRSTEPLLEEGFRSTGGSTAGLQGLQEQDALITPTVHERLRAVQGNVTALGNLVLSLDENELQAVVEASTTEEVAAIKDAANKVWKPGLNRDALYKGERVQIWEAGQGREIKVRTHSGTGFFTVKRGDLTPWLGI